MPAALTPEAYRFDDDELFLEILLSSTVRKIAANNIRFDLDYLADDKYRYEKEILDSNPQVTFGESTGDRRRADVSIEYVDVNVPRIEEQLSYRRADVAKIQRGSMPISERVRRVVRKMAESETRLFFAGDPKVNSTMGSFDVTDTTNNSTSATTQIDAADDTNQPGDLLGSIGDQAGQLFDVYEEEMKNFPLFLVVSPDVYKLFLGMTNNNTDSSIFRMITRLLKELGRDTGMVNQVFSTKYLFGQAGALDFDGPEVILETTGTQASALILGDPDAWRIQTSAPIDQNVYMQGGNYTNEIGYSFLPVFKHNDAIIYGNNVTIA